MFYFTTHSTHLIYGYMASDIWLRTIPIVREETRCRHMGYSFRLTARVLLYHHPTDRIAHTMTFVTPVVEHWLEREIAPYFKWWILHKDQRVGHSKMKWRKLSVFFLLFILILPTSIADQVKEGSWCHVTGTGIMGSCREFLANQLLEQSCWRLIEG